MKLDPEIVEVVARALNYEDGEFSWELTTAGTREWYSNLAQVALAAAIPLIEAPLRKRIEELEDVLREIKKLGRTRGYGREALARIAAHALKESWPPSVPLKEQP